MLSLQIEAKKILSGLILILILLSIPLYSHSSTSPAILGRYSTSYALGLALHAVSVTAILISFAFCRQIAALFYRLNDRILFSMLIVLWFIIVAISQVSIEEQLKVLVIVLALSLILILTIFIKREQPLSFVLKALGIAIVLLIPLQLAYAISAQGYFPDEAGWAERARNFYWGDGIYKPTRLQQPFLITPGYGWFLAIYGWILHHISFSYVVGRIWIFFFNLLAVIGVGLVAWRLYGRKAALLSLSFASLSSFTFFVFDFKANFQLKAIVMFLVFAAAQARLGSHHRLLWHFITGLIATFAMQFHASAITYPLGLSVVYLAEYAYQCYRIRRFADVRPLIFFGLGNSIGTGFFLVFNVLSIGGIPTYFAHLTENRFQSVNIDYLRMFSWNSILEVIPIGFSMAYIAWRRSTADKLFFALLVPIIIINYLTDKFGYVSSYQMLYFVPFGAFVLGGLASARRPFAIQMIVLSLGITGIAVAADTLQSNLAMRKMFATGQLPASIYTSMGDILRPQLLADDVIVSEPDLIWSLPEYHAQIFNYGILARQYRHTGYDNDLEVWSFLAPTIFVDTPRVVVSPDLETYLVQENFRLCEDYPDLMTVYRRECTGNPYGETP